MKQSTAVNRAVRRYEKLRKEGYGAAAARNVIADEYPFIPRAAMARMK